MYIQSLTILHVHTPTYARFGYFTPNQSAIVGDIDTALYKQGLLRVFTPLTSQTKPFYRISTPGPSFEPVLQRWWRECGTFGRQTSI